MCIDEQLGEKREKERKREMKKFTKGFLCLLLAFSVFLTGSAFEQTEVYAASSWPSVATVTQTAQTTDSITINWTASNAVSYNLYQRSSDTSNYVLVAAGITGTSYTVSGLAAGTKYSFQVEAVSSSGKTSSRSISDAKTQVSTVNAYQKSWYHWLLSADVAWDKQTAADYYEYRWLNSSGKEITSQTTTSTYASLSVKNNRIYQFQIRAVQTINGETYTSDWTTIKVLEQPWIAKGTILKSTSSGKKLTVKWKKETGATGYKVYVSKKQTSGYKLVKTVGKKVNSVTISKLAGKKLKKGTYYVYVVSVVKGSDGTTTSGRVYCWKVTKKGVESINSPCYLN